MAHTLVAVATTKDFDFTSMTLGQLQNFEMPFEFHITAITQVVGTI